MTAGAPVLEAKDLTLDYATPSGSVRAVERVSFTVAKGERLVLLGPSGCGKSSILKAVAGFVAPAEGRIALHGRPVQGPGPDRVVVFQEFDQLLPWKTVRDNVAFPLRATGRLRAAEAREKADAAIARVGLARAADAYPHTLSGGMKQRVAIARALAAEPEILLMDEPFAALDALTRETLQAELLGLAESLGFTLLFVTHSIDEAVLIGTKLHLLSAHPGRTIAAFDVSHLDGDSWGSPEFERVAGEVHRLLFGRDDRHGARRAARPQEGAHA
ncbi:ABC transporter ATP-binding protein [Methylopila henanensis]|uniref:ABC transporter ATP-binding protein n=1 Tax=Methylopila henanensis TaxID=873516 RepID=A0ABW4KBU1_9HYPH